ncbi:MAG: hypothetical protein CMB80_05380 [Flammeovirgaceae bacterium]|nr:hypothetical protein [Flammeovirgaceae bacterium]MAH32750.1 hypothetical protein [Marinobacter sp.]|tara:strand:- start:695 stop:940 length:246 start_codon:yes stop_codon:yes gene_type:complete
MKLNEKLDMNLLAEFKKEGKELQPLLDKFQEVWKNFQEIQKNFSWGIEIMYAYIDVGTQRTIINNQLETLAELRTKLLLQP